MLLNLAEEECASILIVNLKLKYKFLKEIKCNTPNPQHNNVDDHFQESPGLQFENRMKRRMEYL